MVFVRLIERLDERARGDVFGDDVVQLYVRGTSLGRVIDCFALDQLAHVLGKFRIDVTTCFAFNFGHKLEHVLGGIVFVPTGGFLI